MPSSSRGRDSSRPHLHAGRIGVEPPRNGGAGSGAAPATGLVIRGRDRCGLRPGRLWFFVALRLRPATHWPSLPYCSVEERQRFSKRPTMFSLMLRMHLQYGFCEFINLAVVLLRCGEYTESHQHLRE